MEMLSQAYSLVLIIIMDSKVEEHEYLKRECGTGDDTIAASSYTLMACIYMLLILTCFPFLFGVGVLKLFLLRFCTHAGESLVCRKCGNGRGLCVASFLVRVMHIITIVYYVSLFDLF